MGLMDTVKAWFNKGKDMAGDAVDKTGDMAGDTYDKTKDMAGDTYDKAKDMVDGDDDNGDEPEPEESGGPGGDSA